ncbi:MAG: SGNH/GDSL hydrolase family protein, partial [Actinobacteria bacterium]|nr:SGNH/GDSL hydrolase family protein [Actinomycetota bacterium]
MNYQRFIALGDSMTEGMTDEVINGKFRGWADRVADVLAKDNPDFSYVNLAVRGKLIGQVAREQVPAALNLIEGKSTLVSFHAGANDVIRPNYDPEKVIAEYTATAKRIATGGGTLMLFCVLENTGEATRSAKIWQKRFEIFNANTRKVATELGAILLDPNQDEFWRDRRFISDDRLHMNA